MKRPLASLALAAVLVAAVPLHAEEPPHLDFVRGLRQKYPDLALEYLEKLLPTATPEQAPALQLELAKTRLDVAVNEPDVGKRLAKYAQTREEFESFLKKYSTHALVPEANLEKARVAVLQGKTQLSIALRQGPGANEAEAQKARGMLEDAGKQLKAAAEQLAEQFKKYPEETKTPQELAEKKTVEQAKLQAEFDVAVNFLDQAQTYVDAAKDEVLKARAEVVKKAVPILEKAAGVEKLASDPKVKNPLKWQAQAYLGRCLHENGEPKKARRAYNDILTEKEPEAEGGKRLARYYLMLVIPEAPEGKENPIKEVEKLGEEWRKLYPSYLNTSEGYGVRHELAEAYLKEAVGEKQQAAQTALYNKALDLYKQLEATDNEYADKARQRKVTIVFNRTPGDKTKADPSKLLTFDDCFVRAQYEAAQMAEEAKKKDPMLDDKRKTHFKTIVIALNRGLDLARKPPKVSDQDLGEAKAMLAYIYLDDSKYAEAKQLGEELARIRPPTSQSSRGAIYAMEAYAHLEDEKEKEGLRKLAEYAEQTWPDDVAGNVARFQLGMFLIRDKKYAEAVAKLSQIKRDYGRYALSQYQLAMAAMQAQQDGAKPVGADKRPFPEQAMVALQNVPDPTAATDPSTAHISVLAKLKLGQLLYAAKKYAELEALTQGVLKHLPDLSLPGDDKKPGDEGRVRDELQGGLVVLSLYATYAKAEAEYKAGHNADVCKVINPTVDQIKAGKLPEAKKDPRLMLGLLSLGLRANVQEGNMDKARAILDLIQESTKDSELEGGSTAILLSLVQTLRDQVHELRKQGDKAKPQLDKTIKSFSDFLDALGKQGNLTTDTLLFLAQSYSSLGMHGKAAGLLEKVAEPKPEGGKDPDPKKIQGYRGARMLYSRELRLDKKYDQSGGVLKEIGEGWGKGSMEVQKEKNLLLEDQEKYAGPNGAAQAWNTMMTSLRPKLSDPRAKEMYWEAYYHLTYCVYKNGLKQSDEKKKAKGIHDAASYIVKLETTQPDMGGEQSKKRFEELLESEKPLKQEYDEQKKSGK